MRTLQEKYNGIQEGKFSKDQFLVEARQQLPNLVTKFNGYDDAVKILKNRGMIQEAYSTEESFKDYSDDALADMIINSSRFEGNEEGIARVKAELARRKEAIKEEVDNKSLFNVKLKNGTIHKNVRFHVPNDPKSFVTSDGGYMINQDIANTVRTDQEFKESVKEDYSKILELPDGNYFAIDGDWEDMYQGNNGLFFSIEGNSIYDKDGEEIQSSPREFLSQFTPDEIVKVEDIGESSQSGHFPSLVGAHKTPEEREAESRHIDDFIKRTGDKEQAEYEKRREERLKAQDERLSAYIASQRNLEEGQDNPEDRLMDQLDKLTPAQIIKLVGLLGKDALSSFIGKLETMVPKDLKEAKLTKKSLTDYRYKPTNEMDKYPYEQILRGLRVELETLGVKDVPTADEYTKALSKVSKNLEKDSIFYTNQVAGVNPKVDLHDKLVDATAKNTVDTFNGMKKAALKEGFKKLIKKMLSETMGDTYGNTLDESDPLHDYMESKEQQISNIENYKKEDSSVDEAPQGKTITIKQLTAIAKRAGNTVMDAKDDLMELGAAYGDAIPMSRVREVLRDYDLTAQDLKNEVVNENSQDLEDLYDKDEERAERRMGAGDQTPKNEESSLEEGPAKNNPKIQKLVDGINQLISQAIDSDGDPIGVIEPGTTWEEPVVYSPIRYVNGALKITTNSGYRGESETYTVLARDMELDGIPTLRLIMRMYKKAVKKAGQQAYPEKGEGDPGYEGYESPSDRAMNSDSWVQAQRDMMETTKAKSLSQLLK